MKSKILRGILSLAVILAILMSTGSALAVPYYPFQDVDPNHEGYDKVMYLYEHGIVSGNGSSFRPDDIISAAELICLLERAFGVEDRIPANWDWSNYSSPWFDSISKSCMGYTICEPTDTAVPAYMAAKGLLAILMEQPENMNLLTTALQYDGYALSDTTEFVLTAAVRGYIPQWDEGYETTGGYKMFDNITRLDAATMIYMTLQENL